MVKIVSMAAILSIIRRYMMEHLKASSAKECHCPICVDARKLMTKLEDDN